MIKQRVLRVISNDNLAAIREVWDRFIDNCTRSYNPSQNLTVDKQLVNFCGNCSLYIPSKPTKSGMTIVMINDNSTSTRLTRSHISPY